MNEDLNNIQYSLIWNYNYSQWFQEYVYDDITLTEEKKKALVTVIDESIAELAEGLPQMLEILNNDKDKDDEYHVIDRTVVSVMLFILITMIDSMVASKYFLLADRDYDRRFMRGKMMVIMNEGFKRLYGFDEKTHNKSE